MRSIALTTINNSDTHEGIAYAEGCTMRTGNAWVQQYHLKDHLGNVRVIVDQSKVVKETNDYYAFGSRWVDASSVVASPANRYRYNGMEEQNWGNLGYYDYNARFYNPAIGRFSSIDPLAEKYYNTNPFVYVLNNPLKFIDPTGMKVEFTRDKDVSRKEFRQMKRSVRELRKNSSSFNTMYKDLDKRKETYSYNATTKNEGDSQDPYVMNIGANYTGNTSENGEEPKQYAQFGMIAHETGHKFRQLHGLDPDAPQMPKLSMNEDNKAAMDKYTSDLQQYHETTERGAMHIENIVRSELKVSGKFSNITLHQFYSPGMMVVKNFGKEWNRISLTTSYDCFLPPRTPNYYNKKFNIYQEHGIKK